MCERGDLKMAIAKNAKHLIVESNTTQFSETNFTKLENIMNEKHFKTNSRVFYEGDACDNLYYVKEGVVKISKVSDNGSDLTLHYFYPGDLFGEFNPNQDKYATFSAEAVTNCTIASISQTDLEQLLSNDGQLALEFSKWLSHMQWYIQLKLRDLLFHGKNGALASFIIRAANTYGISDGDKIHIAKRFTNIEIANMISATRETVNRMLTKLKNDELIEYGQGRITILNLKELKKICHCEECPLGICRL